MNNVFFDNDLRTAVEKALGSRNVPDGQLFLLADEGSFSACGPAIEGVPALASAKKVVIKSGDDHKTIESVIDVWRFLGQNGGTRRSLLVNLGGGMVTDLGGFAANTFKRGIAFINIPTTLLSMVDAAVGGKTGINFDGLKNEIGVIKPAAAVVINTAFLKTLDKRNLLSGYAEMLKHGLLTGDDALSELLAFDILKADPAGMSGMLQRSIEVKENIVAQDPEEKGIRKALNLGHTVGHAFESLSHKLHSPALHGYAVAWGLVAELFLSHKLLGFPLDTMQSVTRFIKDNYGSFPIDCDKYETLYGLMQHDKKNQSAAQVNFTLLRAPGRIQIDCTASKEQIFEALDFYRDAFGQ